MAKVLIVDDDVSFCKMLETFLKRKDFGVDKAFSGESAIKKIREEEFDLILTDVRLPQKDGTAVLEEVKEYKAGTPVILMTGYAEVSLAVEAMKKGAFDYIEKPVRPEKLLAILKRACNSTSDSDKAQEKSKKSKPKKTKEKVNSLKFVSGNSEASKKLDQYIDIVGPTTMSVLITGESGTGKEYVARQIHEKSNRRGASFVAVDCGAIPKELASSEFFGHIKGSFTGALNDKKGHFEVADGGTLFLDEVGNLNYELQVQLLRALQERNIKPVGSNKETKVDIRVVAATNEDLEKAIEAGKFREDLYHRLNEFFIRIPSLREREEDLFLFADHFLQKANRELNKQIVGFSDEVHELFQKYSWPGNFRELQNFIKRAVLFTEEDTITKTVLPEKLLIEQPMEDEGLFKNKEERERIINALKESGGNKSKAARKLNIDRKTLYNKLNTYGIEF